ncbi:MAG: PAS domain S-box protein [Thermanaerothrix sp.]|nr:PAS domain S-box protein [Thermanaerothrix sp.]
MSNLKGHNVMAPNQERASFELLLEISRELAASLDLGTVLARVLFLSTRNVGAERGSLIALNEAGEPIEAAIVIENAIYRPTVAEMREVLEHGLAGWVATHRQAVVIEDTSKDERWVRRADDRSEANRRKSAICVPLLAQDQLVGVLTLVHAKPGFFTSDHLRLLQTIADLAGLAVRNAQLFLTVQIAQQRYRDLFDDSIDPILITTLEGTIIEANRQAAAISGFALPHLVGQSLDVFHPADWEAVKNYLVQGESSQPVTYQGMARRKDGSEFPVEVYVRRVALQGKPYLQWTLRDITERKALDALREDLTAMIYHDLRSPLSNIISSLDILNSLLPLENMPALRPVFQIAMRSTDRLQRLISSLLDINRLEAGQPITNRKPIHPLALVQEAREAVQPLLEGKQQTLVIELPQSLPVVWVDGEMIRRVLINLLENAIKYTPTNGTLCVGGNVQGEFVQLWVQDNGPGIDPAYHEVIFEKFSRIQGERFPRGLGLGLAFCRLAVQAHGGKIWVESPCPETGRGSKFSFTLPKKVR